MVIHAMSSGGAERVFATQANAWVERGWQVTLLTFDNGSEPPFYALDSRVEHRPLGLESASYNALRAVIANVGRVRRLRKAIHDSNPDVVLSALDTVNVLALSALIGSHVPTVVKEDTDPGQKGLGAPWKQLRRALYPRADRIVVLSQEAKSYFPEAIARKTAILPNPIAIAPPGPAREKTGKTAIAIGRFVPDKGFNLLLDAFARIAARHPEWSLVIWGDGPLRAELEAQRARLGLEERVQFPGRTADPFSELRAADLFAMSSRREGFPMALGEAMACGLPAVSFDCPSGPRQLIRPGLDGVLVPDGDVPALAEAMSALMVDDAERARLAERAPDVLDRFGTAKIMAEWESLILDAWRSRSARRRFPQAARFFSGSPEPE
jgi:glycosyltransferase involved in cell wall biosynthesis